MECLICFLLFSQPLLFFLKIVFQHKEKYNIITILQDYGLLFQFCQYISEQSVVLDYTIIKVEADVVVGHHMQLVVVLQTFL